MKKKGCLVTLFAFGLLLLLCAVLFAFNARRVVLWLGGFRGGQETAVVLGELAGRQLPDPSITVREDGRLGGGTRLETVTLQVNGQTTIIDVAAVGAESAEQVLTPSGETVIVVTYDEAEINNLLLGTVMAQAPANTQQQVRNLSVDLKQGAAVVAAEANLGFMWQPFAVVLAFDNTSKQLEVTGIDVAGKLFTPPSSGSIAAQINTLESQANQALAQAAVVGPQGELMTIDQVWITETGLQIVAKE